MFQYQFFSGNEFIGIGIKFQNAMVKLIFGVWKSWLHSIFGFCSPPSFEIDRVCLSMNVVYQHTALKQTRAELQILLKTWLNSNIFIYACIVINVFSFSFLKQYNAMTGTSSVFNCSSVQTSLNLTIYTSDDYNVVGYP